VAKSALDLLSSKIPAAAPKKAKAQVASAEVPAEFED
jgi:hypothetical protein